MFLKISAVNLDMFAAVRERFVRIMREEGAILKTFVTPGAFALLGTRTMNKTA
jgi:hypothetical protein